MRQCNRKCKLRTIGLSIFLAAITAKSVSAEDYHTVALTGNTAPGTAGAFDSFETPLLNTTGHAAFAGTAQSSTPGLWAESGSGLELVALAGVTNPATGGGEQFSFFDAPVHNSSGAASFVGFLTGPGVTLDNNSGVWSKDGTSLELLARAGNPAPGTTGTGGVGGGTPGTLTTSSSQPTVDLDNLDEPDVGGGITDQIRPVVRTTTGNRVIGQSFTPSSTKTLEAIVLLADTAESFNSGTHEIQLAIFEDNVAGGGPGGDTQIGSTEVFSISNQSWGEDTFLTLNLNTPVEITGGQEHHFEFWFTTEDSTHNINFDRSESVGSSVATDGILVVSQILASDPAPTFPLGDNIIVDGGGGNRDLDYGFIYSAGGGIADNFKVLGSPTINQQGRTAFFATLSGGDVIEGTDDNGIWAQDPNGTVQLVVRAGDQAPGTPVGVSFLVVNDRPTLTADGRVVFQSTLTGTGVDSTNNSGMWGQDPNGQILLIARAGDAATGTGAGVNYGSLTETPSVNASGEVAFMGGLLGTGVTSANNRGIWSDESGAMTLVAREDDSAPGISGATFGDLEDSIPVIGDGGEILFRATLEGTGVTSANNASLWEHSGGSLSLLAREGEIAPDVTNSATFLRFEDDLLVNGNGDSAFVAILKGAGVTSANNLGIWAEDSDGTLHLVARTGDLFDVDDGVGVDERTITDLSLLSPTSALGGPAPAFTSAGLLAFLAEFDDNSSGIFVADLSTFGLPGDFDIDGDVDGFDFLLWQRNPAVGSLADWEANYGSALSSNATTVPEPSSLLLCIVCSGLLTGSRRRV